MTDPTEFDIDLTISQPLSHRQQAELFAFDDCKTYRLPERKLLIRNPYNGRSAVIMPEVLTALAQCTRFSSFDEHIENVGKAIPQLREHPDQIRQVLRNMVRDGMMVPAKTVCDAFNARSVEMDAIADQPAVVAIITCDRPEAIERLLGSIAEHGDPAGFERLYVIDDSRKAENIERTRAAVDAFDLDSAIDTVYFGRDSQRALLHRLIQGSPENEESIRFLIDFERWQDEWTGGLARNYALLLSVGKRLVMLDDDVLFQVYEPQPRPAGINLRDEIREAEFFDEIGDWPGLKLRSELDPVKAHLYCLGLPLRRAMERLGENALRPEHLVGCTVAEARRLEPNARVLATQCGSLGEPGVGHNAWIIELAGASRERMLASEESVARAIRNDNAWIGRRQPHFGPRPNMSAITGLDNRHPLPPYFPIGRGEDRMFGIMLDAMVPTAVALDYPWSAPHLALEQRSKRPQEADPADDPDFGELFSKWLEIAVTGNHHLPEAEHGDASLARMIRHLAQAAPGQLTELRSDLATQALTNDLVDFRRALAMDSDAPDGWRTFLESLSRVTDARLRRLLAANAGQIDRSDDPDSNEEEWARRFGQWASTIAAWRSLRGL